jgi:hypothetical protein
MAATHPAWPQVAKAGGPVLDSFRLVTVTTEGDPDGPELQAVSAEIVASQWWTTVGQDYGVPSASATVSLVGPAITSAVSFGDVLTYLMNLAADAGPPGDLENLYLLYLPDGIGFSDMQYVCGYHSAFSDATAPAALSGSDAFGVVSRDSTICEPVPGDGPLDIATLTASHELIEAATDPLPSSGYVVGDTPQIQPWLSPIWLSFEPPSPEVADLCEADAMDVVLGGEEVAVQRIWSNTAAAKGGDPCVPSTSAPYFNTSAAAGWYPVSAGGSVDIPLLGWSTAPTDNWVAGAYVIQYQNLGDPLLTLTTDLGEQTFTDPTCQFTRPVMNNNVAGVLNVAVPSNQQPGDFAVIAIESNQPLSSTCYFTPSNGDLYHLWYVGVYVQ